MTLLAPALDEGRRERRGLFVAFVAFGLFWGAWSAVIPAVKARNGLSDGQLGLALAVIALSALVPMRFAGRALDRWGSRWLVPGTITVFAAAVTLPGLSRSPALLVPALVLLGIGSGALDVVLNAATAVWERLEDAHLMGTAHGGFSTGVLLGSASAGAARQAGSGPEPVLLVVAAALGLSLLAQPRFRSAVAAPAPRRRGLSRSLLVLGVLTAGAFLVEDAVQSWSALRLEVGLHADPLVSGAGPALFASAMAVGRFSAGALQRRVRDERLMVATGSAVAVGVLLVALAPDVPVALVGLVVTGAGASLLAPLLYGATGRRAAPGAQASDLGTVSTLGYAGFLAGPPLVGAVSAGSSLPVAFGLLALVGVALAAGGHRALSGKMTA